MTLIFSVLDRIELLPYFFQYYQKVGIDRFVCCLFQGSKSPLYYPIMEHAPRGSPIHMRETESCSIDDMCGLRETPGLNAAREEFIEADEWFAVADLDEFHVSTVSDDLVSLADLAEQAGYSAVHGRFLDRIAADGSFASIDPSKTLDEQFPLACNASLALTRYKDGIDGKANDNKYVLQKGSVVIGSGHHCVDVPALKECVHVHHFKWTSGLIDRMRSRGAAYRQQGWEWWAECQAICDNAPNSIPLDFPGLCVRAASKLGV